MITDNGILELVKLAVEAHPQDCQEALKVVRDAMPKLRNYDTLISQMVDMACKELIHKRRHQINVKIRKETGVYASIPSTVQTMTSKTVQRVYRSVYTYCLGGTTLGNILGEQLEEIANREEKAAKGHEFNVNLCRKLREFVKDGQRVSDVFKDEKELRQIFLELNGVEQLAEATA